MSEYTDVQAPLNSALRKISAIFWHREKGRGRGQRTHNTFTVAGLRCAWPDVVVVWPKVCFIECKVIGAKLKPEQEQFFYLCDKLGLKSYIARSMEDVAYIVKWLRG